MIASMMAELCFMF